MRNATPMYSVIRSLWIMRRSARSLRLTPDIWDAAIIHEAAIGRINDEQLIKLRTLGMTEEEAEGVIIENFLN